MSGKTFKFPDDSVEGIPQEMYLFFLFISMNQPLHARLEKELLYSQFKITFAQDIVDEFSVKGWKVMGNAWDINGELKEPTQDFNFTADFQDAKASWVLTMEDESQNELCVCISSAKGYKYSEKVLPVYINGSHIFANLELHDDARNPEKHEKKLGKICKRLNKLISNYMIGLQISKDMRSEISALVDTILSGTTAT